MKTSSTKDTPRLLKVKGGPNLCETCSKAVRITGAVIFTVIILGVFFVISAFRGLGGLEAVAFNMLLTLPVATLGILGMAYTVGLPFKQKSIEKTVEAKRESTNRLVCDGCRNTYLAGA